MRHDEHGDLQSRSMNFASLAPDLKSGAEVDELQVTNCGVPPGQRTDMARCREITVVWINHFAIWPRIIGGKADYRAG